MSDLTIEVVDQLCLKYAKMITKDIHHYDRTVELPEVEKIADEVYEVLRKAISNKL